MTTFEFRAVDRRGAELAGTLESSSRAVALRILDARGLVPLEISTRGETRRPQSRPSSRWWRLSRSRNLGARPLARLTQSLAALLAAGLTVDRALAVVANVDGASATHALAKRLEKSVQAGQAFADAFAKSEQKLPSYYVSMIQAGEVSGTLPAALQRLADLQHRSGEIAERIRSALIYPLLLAGVVLATLIVLLAFVLPRFELMFAETDAATPASTRAVLTLGRVVADYWWAMLLAAAAFAAGGLSWWRSPAGRARFDRWLVSTRLLLEIPVALATARFLRTLATLLSSGTPLPDAMKIASTTVENRALAQALTEALAAVKAGQGFATSLGTTKLFPAVAVQLAQVGEETGRLDSLLASLAEFLDQEAQHRIERLLSLIVPGAVILMGGIVAALVGSVLLGLLSVNDLAF
jgi:general secretion pathway protein F